MKITCNFCGTAFNDTQELCPHCGAPNAGIVRTANEQPITIEQLKKWYEDRGLPPAETTRFFIGVDYKQPRAFGIYKDENTGVCTVYKNKDNGERAIRYEGTDEAYAVNELYQRLKQEIIQQKMNNVKKNNNYSSTGNSAGPGVEQKSGNWFTDILKGALGIFGIGVLFVVGFFVILFVIGGIIMLGLPKVGYYDYEGTKYYYCDTDYAGYSEASYYQLVGDEWEGAIYLNDMPEEMQGRSSSKHYFLAKEWDSSLKVPDFSQSAYAADMKTGFNIESGYYIYDGEAYYNISGWFDSSWYKYDSEWIAVELDSLPKELKHPSMLTDYYIAQNYSSSIPCSDFTDTIFYRDSLAATDIDRGYYACNNRNFYHIESNYSDGWYEYSDNDWYSVDYGDLPDDMHHNSIVTDFYYTPTWDASTQITDFTSSYAYQEYEDSQNSSSSDDSDYDWGSSDSWDSGSTDFGSDW